MISFMLSLCSSQLLTLLALFLIYEESDTDGAEDLIGREKQ